MKVSIINSIRPDITRKMVDVESMIDQFIKDNAEKIKSEFELLDIFQSVKEESTKNQHRSINFDYSMKANYITNTSDLPEIKDTFKYHDIKNIEIAIELEADDLFNSISYNDVLFRMLKQAMRANFDLLSRTCLFGNDEAGITGLLNNNEIISEATNYDKVDQYQILKELQKAHSTIIQDTSIVPDTMLISCKLYNHIALNDEWSKVFDHFAKTRNIKVIPIIELNDAFRDNTNGYILLKNSNEVLYYVVAPLFAVSPVIPRGFNSKIYCRSRSSGLIIRRPEAIAIRYGCLK